MSTVYPIFQGVGMLKQCLTFKDLVHITFFISWTASLLSLTALALDRFLAITYPLMYRTKFNHRGASLISLMVWIVSILLPMIHFIVGYNKFRLVFANTAVAVTFSVLTNPKNFKYLRYQVQQWDDLHDYSTEENFAKKQSCDDWMGEENNKNPGHCTGVIFSVLPACMYFHIHHKLLHKLRLRVYSLGKRHSDYYGNANSGANPFVYI